MDRLLYDIRYALRSLRKNPGFAALAILALALGIGSTTAIFSVVNGVLLRPLPFPDAGRLFALSTFTVQNADGAFSPADYLDVRRDVQAFAHVAAYREDIGDLGSDSGEPDRVPTLQVTHGFFDVLGAAPAAGRLFHDRDGAGAGRVAVISHALWKQRFAGDPSVVGRSIRVSSSTYEIAAVLGEGQGWPAHTGLWLLAGELPPSPIAYEGELREQRQLQYFSVLGRLRGDATPARAAQDLTATAAAIAARHPDSNDGRGFRAVPLVEDMVGDVRRTLLVLLGAVGVVLLIACANVANLLLARAAGRQRDVSIRLALGAARSRLIRQFLTESLLLSVLGGAVGLLAALWGVRILLALAPDNLPRVQEVTVDGSVAAFAVMASIVTGLLFGVVPAFQTSQVDVVDALKESGRTSGGRRTRATRRLLVIGEVAMAVVLLVGAGLLLRSLTRLLSVETGFRTEQVMALNVPLSQSRYPDSAQQSRFYGQVLDRLAVQAQVQSAALLFPLPMGGFQGSATFRIEGRDDRPRSEQPSAALASVSPGLFATLGVPILRGRDIGPQDVEKVPGAVVISDAARRKYWPDEDPIGRRIDLGDGGGDSWFTVVGVVGDVRLKELDQPPGPTVYLSYRQFSLPYMSFVVRTTLDAGETSRVFHTAIREIDKDLPVDPVKPLATIVSGSAEGSRFRAVLVAAFAGAALVLAAIGLYGVISQTVSQRTREMGIRLALGGSPGHVLEIVLRDGLMLTAIGLAVGLVLSLVATRAIRTLLFDVTPGDPVTFIAVPALLLVIAALASYIPARRAMRVDPMTALRVE